MAQKQGKRKQDIVFLNILFCLLVIFIHCSSEVIVQMNHDRTMYWIVRILSRLSAFVVQGFILLSGVKLFLKAGNVHYGRFYLSRLMSVILPYALWVIVYYLYFCYRDYFTFSWMDLGQYILWGDLAAHFYFIVVITQFYLLAPLWMLLFRRMQPTVLLLVTLMINVICGIGLGDLLSVLFPGRSFAHLDVLFLRYLFYWTAGCVIGLHYREFQDFLRRRWMGITLLFLVCAGFEAWVTVCGENRIAVILDQIHTLYCISAILFFYMLAQLFTDGGAIVLRPLAWIDQSAYGIYLIHCLVIFIVNDCLDNHNITDIGERYGLRALAAYFGSILLCLLWQAVKRIFIRLLKKT